MHAIDNMRRYLELESMDKKKTEYDTSQWTQYLPGVCRLVMLRAAPGVFYF